MARFIEGEDRRQRGCFQNTWRTTSQDNPVRVIDVFVDELDLAGLGFKGVQAASTGRPGYQPGSMLKLYLYGCLNQVQSSRRLEREARRNTELMWLLGKLAPDFKTIADFRRDNGEALRAACAAFVAICRQAGLLTGGAGLAVKAAAIASATRAVRSRTSKPASSSPSFRQIAGRMSSSTISNVSPVAPAVFMLVIGFLARSPRGRRSWRSAGSSVRHRRRARPAYE